MIVLTNNLAIDVGTTAIKFVLYGKNNVVLSTSSVDVKTYHGDNRSAYQKPAELFAIIADQIKELAKTFTIEKISLSTAMHSLILEEAGEPIAYIWSDNQASEVIATFKKTALAADFYQRTGTPIHAMSPFAKLLFFKETAPKRLAKAKSIYDLKSYLMDQLTGQRVIDFSVASATGLFNSEKMSWDEKILGFLNVDSDKLPQLVDTTTTFAILLETARELSLSNETQIMIGASDGCLASWASYLSTGSKLSLTIGTSGAVRQICDKRQLAQHGEAFCYYLKKDVWVVSGQTNNGGAVLNWFGDIYFDHQADVYDYLTTALQTSPIGANGLTFLPYLFGERAPFWDEKKAAGYLGLRDFHTKNDLLRATMEGILFNLKMIGETLAITESAGAISGGFFKIPEASTMLATIFNLPCLASTNNEPAFGLQTLNETQAATDLKQVERILPNENELTAYQTSYDRFKKLANTEEDEVNEQ